MRQLPHLPHCGYGPEENVPLHRAFLMVQNGPNTSFTAISPATGPLVTAYYLMQFFYPIYSDRLENVSFLIFWWPPLLVVFSFLSA